jgi:hypothetical protein
VPDRKVTAGATRPQRPTSEEQAGSWRTAFRAHGVSSARRLGHTAFGAQIISGTRRAYRSVGHPCLQAVVTTLAHGSSRACLCQPLNAFISGGGKAENGGKTENGVTTDSGGTADGGAQPTAERHGRSAVAEVLWQNFCGRSLGHRLGSEIQKPVSSRAERKWVGQSLCAPPPQMVSRR